MLNQTRLFLALTILAIAATVMAAFEGMPSKYTVTITLQITDDRWLAGWKNNTAGFPGIYLGNRLDPGYFTAGKNYTIIIRALQGSLTDEEYNQISRFWDLRITTLANGTEAGKKGGFIQATIDVYSTEVNYTYTENNQVKSKYILTDWYVAIILNDWPDKGYSWLLLNGTIHNATVLDVLWLLGGNIPRSWLVNQTVKRLAEKASINGKAYLGNKPGDVIDSGANSYYWANITRVWLKNGQMVNYTIINTTAIHLWFLRVPKPLQGLTYTLTLKYTIGSNTYQLYSGPRNETLTNAVACSGVSLPSAGCDVFGPFFYVGSLVKDLKGKGESVELWSYSDVNRKLYATVDASFAGVTGSVITSENTLGDFASNGVTIFGEAKTIDYSVGGTRYLEGGILVTWVVPTAVVQIDSVLDLKGNIVISPEHIVFKIQQPIGGSQVIMSEDSVRFNGGIGQFVYQLKQTCANKGAPIYDLSDVAKCYRLLNKTDLANIYKNLLRSAVLTTWIGSLALKDDSPRVSSAQVSAKLVAEYVDAGSGYTVSATVGVYPLVLNITTSGSLPVVWVKIPNLTVSLLPVRVELYQYTADSLYNSRVPASLAQYLANLRVVFSGGGIYLNRSGTEVIVRNLWTNNYMVALPPYDFVSGLVGNVALHVPSLFNASGLLPLSPVYGIITNDPGAVSAFGGYVIYLNTTTNGWSITSGGRTSTTLKLFGQNRAIKDIFAAVGVNTWSISQQYTLEVYLGGIRVGVARLESLGYRVWPNGTIVENSTNLANALHAQYITVPYPVDVYAVDSQVVRGRLYSVEHRVYVALTTFVLNILPRDLCGSPLPGGTISVTISSNGQSYTNKFSVPSYAGELSIPMAIPVNPDGSITMQNVMLTAALDYYGYTLPAVNKTLQPATIEVSFRQFEVNATTKTYYLPIVKQVVYFPISPVLFSVWSQTPDGKLKDRLSGFVVSVFSTMPVEAPEITRSISNLTRYGDIKGETKYGYAWAEGVPIGVPFRVVVRTIIPSVDMVYPYTASQADRHNSFQKYVSDMGGVYYTLGTRGPIDEGVVVLNRTYIITAENYTIYMCGAQDIRLPVEVYDLRVSVYDSTGKYLLRSVPIDLGPFPGASRPVLSNVTLIIYEGRFPTASRYLGTQQWVSTSYSIIGMTGVRTQYYLAAKEYADRMADALNCKQKPGKAVDWANGVYNMSYAAFFNRIANASTDSFNAVFTITSQQPKVVGDPCDTYKADYRQIGTNDVAHLFLKGQRYHFIVWYMGYKVFDDWVTITSPNVTIKTSVVPVVVQPVSKCCGMNVTAFVGFTFADSMTGAAVSGIDLGITQALIRPFNYLTTLQVANLVNRVEDTDYVLSGGADVYRNGQPFRSFGSYYGFSNGIVADLVPNYATVHNGTDVKYGAILTTGTGGYNYTVVKPSSTIPLSAGANFQANITITPKEYVRILGMKFDNNNRLVSIRVVANASSQLSQAIALTYKLDGKTYTYRADAVDLNVTIVGGWLNVDPTGFTINATSAGSGVFSLTMKGTLINYTRQTVTVTSPAGFEEAVGLYRWLLTPGGDVYEVYPNYPARSWLSDRLPWLSDIVLPWSLISPWLIVNQQWQQPARSQLTYSDVNKRWEGSFTLSTYDGNIFGLLSYRTLVLWLPVRQYYVSVGRVVYRSITPVVTIEARYANNDTLIDKATFTIALNTTDYEPVVAVDLLTLNWTYGKLPALAKYVDPDTGSGISIKFKIYVTLKSGGSVIKQADLNRWYPVDTHSLWYAVTSRVPFKVTYAVDKAGSKWVTVDGRAIPKDKYTIYTTPVYDYGDPNDVIYYVKAAVPQLVVDPQVYYEGGFGAPITYIVEGGQVALLPAWAAGSAAYGSRIARIWVFTLGGPGTPALGTNALSDLTVYEWVAPDGSKIERYDFSGGVKYLVINYVPKVANASYISKVYYVEPPYGTDEIITVGGQPLTFRTLSGKTAGLGFGTSGTSTLVLSTLYWAGACGIQRPVAFWNSTELASLGVVKIPTTALTGLTVYNNATFPIYVGGVEVQYGGDKYSVDSAQLVRVESGNVTTVDLRGYAFGLSHFFTTDMWWNYTSALAAYNYTALAYHGGIIDAIKHFGTLSSGELSKRELEIVKKLEPLRLYVTENVLYASAAEIKKWTIGGWWTKGVWDVPAAVQDAMTVRASDCDFKYAFRFPTLPLKEIRDWNDRPLANQTVVLFGVKYNEQTRAYETKIYAVSYTGSDGSLVYVLPDIAGLAVRPIVRVSWYDGFLRELVFGRPEYTIWVYDSSVDTDVKQLGCALSDSKIRTWVYPLTVTVLDVSNKPLSDMWVKVYDISTTGHLVNALNRTASDGGAQVVDLRVSKYASGVMSQIPPTSYYYEVYDSSGILVASGKFDIQRGATVPSTGWNVQVRVSFISEIPVKNSATRGYMVVKGVKFMNGTTKDVIYPFTVAGGVMQIQGRVPLSYSYPVEVYVTHVTLGGQEVPVKGGKFLVYRGTTADLAAGLDFAELGLTGVVSISAVDSTGAPRADWTIQVLFGNITAAEGKGTLTIVLPRTDVLGQPYTVRVVTNAITPEGKALVKEQPLEVAQKAFALQIPISTVRVVVQAVDGFGNVRNDWPVVVENVASGMGQVSAEVVEGQRYVARATGLGFTNTTAFEAKGPQMVVTIKIPTAKITAQVKDGFGKVRSDWPVEIVGVAAGQGTVGPVEVLAGQYTVKTSVFGKEFTQTVTLQAGQSQTVTVQVPTAVLSVTAVDDDRKPIDRYVTAVQISGPVSQSFSMSPKNLEVLAGQYTVTVSALGKQASTQVTLQPGQTVNVEVVVPGTAGLDFLGTRIPLPTLVLYALLLLVIVVILAIIIIEYNNWRRRRLMQILAPPK